MYAQSFPKAEQVVVCGDIHGDFTPLVYLVCKQYKLTNTLVIVAGDCGFGFEKAGYYENLVQKNTSKMEAANNWIVFIRGNHDNPAYFQENAFQHERFMTVPDYTVLQACSHNILCVGGAISVDRHYRLEEYKKDITFNQKHNIPIDKGPFARNLYWEDEAPVWSLSQMDTITQSYQIDTVITHTAPSFCEFTSKIGLQSWADKDPSLLTDAQAERAVMDNLFHYLQKRQHPITDWLYGHFHQSWNATLHQIHFRMLDIMEFYSL